MQAAGASGENARSLVRIVLVSSRIGHREVPCDISANHRVQQFDTKTLLNHSQVTCFPACDW